jgi:hypothetical protein
MGGMEALQALRLMTRGRERLPVDHALGRRHAEAKREALEAGATPSCQADRGAALLDEIQPLRRATTDDARARPSRCGRAPRGRATPAVVNDETLATSRSSAPRSASSRS